MALSKTQIDRLGDRLRAGSPTPSDLELLEGHRLSFRTAYDVVFGVIRDRLSQTATGRPAKSTGSIIEKLQRETIRLSQVQDIAGCRVVVGGVAEQEWVVASLRVAFPEADVVDRRSNPSHGYRAVHVIVRESGKLVEVQVRTALQHLWAELSEKFSDVVHPNLKYGGGPEEPLKLLTDLSQGVALIEQFQVDFAEAEADPAPLPKEAKERLEKVRQGIDQAGETLASLLNMVSSHLSTLKGKWR